MQKWKPVLMAVLSWQLFLASSQAQETNPPPTKLEAFETQTGTILVKGYAVLGTIAMQTDTVTVRYKESVDMLSHRKEYGIAIRLQEDQPFDVTTIIDYDELDPFLTAIDYLSKVDYTVTSLSGFEASFTTKGGFKFSAYSSKRNEAIQIGLQSIYFNKARVILTREQAAQFYSLIQQAKTRLDALRAAK